MSNESYPTHDTPEKAKRSKLLTALIIVLSGYGVVLNTDIHKAFAENDNTAHTGIPATSFDDKAFMQTQEIPRHPEPVDDGSGYVMHPDSVHSQLREYFAYESFHSIVSAQRDWTLQYIQSPQYRRILLNQMHTQYALSAQPPSDEYLVSEANRIIHERMARVQSAPAQFYSVLYVEGEEAYGSANVDGEPSTLQISLNKRLFHRDPATAVHEFAHVAHGSIQSDVSLFALYPQISMYISGLAMGRSPAELREYIVDRRAFLVGAEQYQFRAWEVTSFVTQLKFYADIMEIMDPLHEEFTREHYDGLKHRMLKILPDNHWLRVYFDNIPAENIIELINSVTDSDVLNDDIVIPGPVSAPVSKVS